jgi:hypothetical protein
MEEVVHLCRSQAQAATTATGGPTPAAPTCQLPQEPAAESQRAGPTQQQRQQQERAGRQELEGAERQGQDPGLASPLPGVQGSRPSRMAADGSDGVLPRLPMEPANSAQAGCDHRCQGPGLSSSGSGSRGDCLVPRVHGAASAALVEACQGGGNAAADPPVRVPAEPPRPEPVPMVAAG